MGYDAVFVGTGAGYPTLHGHPRRLAQRRALGQRVADALQPDARARLPDFDTPLPSASASPWSAPATPRWTRCASRCASAPRRSTASTGAAQAEAPARVEEVHHAEEEGVEFHWLTSPVELLGDGEGSVRAHALRAHGARRARRLRAAAARCRWPAASSRSRPTSVVFAIGTNANPIMGQTSRPEAQQARLHRDRREPRHLDGGRLCRRRHRHRRRHRDPGDGRRPQGGARHEGLSRPARHRARLPRGRQRAGKLFGIDAANATSPASASPDHRTRPHAS